MVYVVAFFLFLLIKLVESMSETMLLWCLSIYVMLLFSESVILQCLSQICLWRKSKPTNDQAFGMLFVFNSSNLLGYVC